MKKLKNPSIEKQKELLYQTYHTYSVSSRPSRVARSISNAESRILIRELHEPKYSANGVLMGMLCFPKGSLTVEERPVAKSDLLNLI